MKPLRPIVTAWIKQLEPKRLSHYGPYHKKLPKEQPPASTPPWWPHDVPYEEPSHLDKNGNTYPASSRTLTNTRRPPDIGGRCHASAPSDRRS
jgi:hypothetical protein